MRSLLVLEDATCSQANIKMKCYENIKSFFDKVVDHAIGFNTREFVDFLRIGSSDIEDEAVLRALKAAKSKNAEFIAYVLNRINEWGLYPRTLSWAKHVESYKRD